MARAGTLLPSRGHDIVRLPPRFEGDALKRLDRSLISGLPPFQGLSANDLDRMLKKARSLHVPRGDSIFEQDARADFFFLLLVGHARVVKTTPAGQQVVVRYINPGELLGIAHALGHSAYPASAIAADDCVVLAWPDALWPQFAADFPDFGTSTYRTVGSRLQDAHTRVVEMATEQVEQRVARALLRLAETSGRKVEDGVQIDFPISRQDIAEMTGTTLHTVSRLLTAWGLKGLVRSGRQKVTVVEPRGLLQLAEGGDRQGRAGI